MDSLSLSVLFHFPLLSAGMDACRNFISGELKQLFQVILDNVNTQLMVDDWSLRVHSTKHIS